MKTVLTPPRVFLDTSHLSRLADIRAGRKEQDSESGRAQAYRTILRWINNGFVTPVVCTMLVGEWLRHASARRAMEYAAVFDSAVHALEIPVLSCVCIAEGINALGHLRPNLGFPRFSLIRPLSFVDDVLLYISDHHPSIDPSLRNLRGGLPPGVPPKMSLRSLVRLVRQMRHFSESTYKVGIDGDRHCFQVSRSTADVLPKGERASSARVREWMLHAFPLREIAMSAFPHGDIENALRDIDMRECPGTRLYYSEYLEYVRSKREYDAPSDFFDQSYVAGLAYCDFALVDRRLAEFVRKAVRRLSPPVGVFATKCPIELVVELAKRGLPER